MPTAPPPVRPSAPPPLPIRPRLDPKPWGGRGLADFGFDLPPNEPIGEALLTAAEAVVAAGPNAGRTLGELTEAAPEAIAGRIGLAATGGRPIFPLLVKLIEATAPLSIQVHPDDAAAQQAGHDSVGKTEAWHVLAAAPGAALLLGLREGADHPALAAAVRRGDRLAPLMRSAPARRGETVLLPAGTIHALGAGCLIYEIQQPSELTYRLDDWGRVDAAGHPRPLHVDAGLAVADPASRPSPIQPVELRVTVGRRQLLVACRYFALERLALPAGGTVTLSSASPRVLTCVAGAIVVATNSGSAHCGRGETVAIPAVVDLAHVRAQTPSVLLHAWAPDLRSEVEAPARHAGVSAEAIAALAQGTGDLDFVLR